MSSPWDKPPYPKRGNRDQRVLYQAIGRALMIWEDVETAFAHLYSSFNGGDPFDLKFNRKYGESDSFVRRLAELRKSACAYFSKNCSQHAEGKFAEIVRYAEGYSQRRNEIAHGRARPIHWILKPNSQETLLSLQERLEWCVIPAHFRETKFTPDNMPIYIYTSREIHKFADAFHEIIRETSNLNSMIQPPPPSWQETPSLLSEARSTK
jgi:hypothetical protein